MSCLHCCTASDDIVRCNDAFIFGALKRFPTGTDMAYAHTTQPANGLLHRLYAFVTELGLFFELLGAAQRVAIAIEHRTPPQPQDLKRLGVESPLPRSF